jgi:predicted membrane protein
MFCLSKCYMTFKIIVEFKRSLLNFDLIVILKTTWHLGGYKKGSSPPVRITRRIYIFHVLYWSYWVICWVTIPIFYIYILFEVLFPFPLYLIKKKKKKKKEYRVDSHVATHIFSE